MDKRKLVRYLLIAFIYNLFLSSLIYTMDWLNDTFFQYSFQDWDFVEWWFFISINGLIMGFLFYMIPAIEKWLKSKEDKFYKRIDRKKDNGVL